MQFQAAHSLGLPSLLATGVGSLCSAPTCTRGSNAGDRLNQIDPGRRVISSDYLDIFGVHGAKFSSMIARHEAVVEVLERLSSLRNGPSFREPHLRSYHVQTTDVPQVTVQQHEEMRSPNALPLAAAFNTDRADLHLLVDSIQVFVDVAVVCNFNAINDQIFVDGGKDGADRRRKNGKVLLLLRRRRVAPHAQFSPRHPPALRALCRRLQRILVGASPLGTPHALWLRPRPTGAPPVHRGLLL